MTCWNSFWPLSRPFRLTLLSIPPRVVVVTELVIPAIMPIVRPTWFPIFPGVVLVTGLVIPAIMPIVRPTWFPGVVLVTGLVIPAMLWLVAPARVPVFAMALFVAMPSFISVPLLPRISFILQPLGAPNPAVGIKGQCLLIVSPFNWPQLDGIKQVLGQVDPRPIGIGLVFLTRDQSFHALHSGRRIVEDRHSTVFGLSFPVVD